jgi:hypothetical protein
MGVEAQLPQPPSEGTETATTPGAEDIVHPNPAPRMGAAWMLLRKRIASPACWPGRPLEVHMVFPYTTLQDDKVLIFFWVGVISASTSANPLANSACEQAAICGGSNWREIEHHREMQITPQRCRFHST